MASVNLQSGKCIILYAHHTFHAGHRPWRPSTMTPIFLCVQFGAYFCPYPSVLHVHELWQRTNLIAAFRGTQRHSEQERRRVGMIHKAQIMDVCIMKIQTRVFILMAREAGGDFASRLGKAEVRKNA